MKCKIVVKLVWKCVLKRGGSYILVFINIYVGSMVCIFWGVIWCC